jgi:hypothetical protein
MICTRKHDPVTLRPLRILNTESPGIEPEAPQWEVKILQVPTSVYRLVVLIKSLRKFEEKQSSRKIRTWNLGAVFSIVWHHIVTKFGINWISIHPGREWTVVIGIALDAAPQESLIATDMASVGDNNLFERMRFPSRRDHPGMRAGNAVSCWNRALAASSSATSGNSWSTPVYHSRVYGVRVSCAQHSYIPSLHNTLQSPQGWGEFRRSLKSLARKQQEAGKCDAWLTFRPWLWRRHVPPKCRLTFAGLRGVILQ